MRKSRGAPKFIVNTAYAARAPTAEGQQKQRGREYCGLGQRGVYIYVYVYTARASIARAVIRIRISCSRLAPVSPGVACYLIVLLARARTRRLREQVSLSLSLSLSGAHLVVGPARGLMIHRLFIFSPLPLLPRYLALARFFDKGASCKGHPSAERTAFRRLRQCCSAPLRAFLRHGRRFKLDFCLMIFPLSKMHVRNEFVCTSDLLYLYLNITFKIFCHCNVQCTLFCYLL